MQAQSTNIELRSPEATAQFAVQLAVHLRTGDTILLTGGLGAGKTHFARSLIQSVLTVPEDVPSPTYTLVQVYDTQIGEIWHADLYRIGSVHELEELGLTEAFDNAICLIEWPDRLGDLCPASALTIDLSDGAQDEARVLHAVWSDARWDDVFGKAVV